jgi:hypothetical protein
VIRDFDGPQQFLVIVVDHRGAVGKFLCHAIGDLPCTKMMNDDEKISWAIFYCIGAKK